MSWAVISLNVAPPLHWRIKTLSHRLFSACGWSSSDRLTFFCTSCHGALTRSVGTRDGAARGGCMDCNHHHVCWRSGCGIRFDFLNNEGRNLHRKVRHRWGWNAQLGVRFSGWEMTQGMRENLQEREGQKGHPFIWAPWLLKAEPQNTPQVKHRGEGD